MGILGAMSGGGAGLGDIGRTMFHSTLQEERDRRVAEYKATADAANNAQKHKNNVSLEGMKHQNAMERDANKPQRELVQDKDGAYYSADHNTGGATPFNVDGTPLRGPLKGGASSDLTNSGKKYRELLQLGVPEQAAMGVAYGTYDAVTDPRSGATVLIDVTSGGEVGRMMKDIKTGHMEWVPAEDAPNVPVMTDDEAQGRAEKAADKIDPIGPNFLRPDATAEAFGPGGRDAWVEGEAKRIQYPGRSGGILNRTNPDNQTGQNNNYSNLWK